jgi:hypothetical protein
MKPNTTDILQQPGAGTQHYTARSYFLQAPLYRLVFFCMAAMAAACVGGCSKILDKSPKTEIDASHLGDSTSNVSAAQAEKLIAGCYTAMVNDNEEYFVLDRVTNGDVVADNCYAGGDNPDNFQLDLFTTSSINGNVRRDWADLYTVIGKVNETIQQVGSSTDPALTATRKNQILGEARFLRAFCYFDLVRLWGAVPLMLAPANTSSTQTVFNSVTVPRASVDSVYLSIIDDLNFALQHVRDNGAVSDKQTVTKGVVNAVLAQVYATQTPADWNKVIQYCDAVIPNYALLSNYADLWDNNHENNSESIWEFNYAGWSNGYGNWAVDQYRSWNFSNPTNDLVNTFIAEGDSVRYHASVAYKNVTGSSYPHWPSNHLAMINKMLDDKSNAYILRLPAILLLKAEALTANGDLTGAAALVNQVRARVGLAPKTASSAAAMNLIIEKERRLELCFEGYRWFDLLRTGRAMAVMQAQTDENGQNLNYNIKPYRLLFPIPQTEMDRNPLLKQNPGY